MLYIWPFFAFFSAPLLLPSFLPLITVPFRLARKLLSPPQQPSPREKSFLLQAFSKIYYTPYIFGTVLLSLAVVKFNTIIHPFTLADNRHYMFYVFRYTILRSVQLRYWLVAGYTLSRWLVWHALTGYSTPAPTNTATSSTTVSATTAAATTTTTTAKPKQAKTTATPKPAPPAAKQTPTPPSTLTSPPTSTALLWLLSTTLSLITAPLVEPRYFILPWLFWRLLLPAWTPIGNNNPSTSPSSASPPGWITNKLKTLRGVDPRLFLETVWFLAINLGTMYMFLFRPFYWRDSNGNGELLDDGKVQRFMW